MTKVLCLLLLKLQVGFLTEIIAPSPKSLKPRREPSAPTAMDMAMLYARLAHSLSLNDICDSLYNHAGTLIQIRHITHHITHPSRNGVCKASIQVIESTSNLALQ